jgi:hypothetical protein
MLCKRLRPKESASQLNFMPSAGDWWLDPEVPSTHAAVDDRFARKPRDLGVPVVPVLYVSCIDVRREHHAPSEHGCDWPPCIMAEGIGVRDMKDSKHYHSVVGDADPAADLQVN